MSQAALRGDFKCCSSLLLNPEKWTGEDIEKKEGNKEGKGWALDIFNLLPQGLTFKLFFWFSFPTKND